MLKRPMPGDDESEILRMQEEYLAEKSKNQNFEPAAKVVNLRSEKVPKPCIGTRKPSKYAQAKGLGLKVQFEEASTSIIGDILERNVDCEDDKVYHPEVIPTVLGNIVEKNTDVFKYVNFQATSQGFPVATKHESASNSKKSVFSQHMSKLHQTDPYQGVAMEIDSPVTRTTDNKSINVPHKSFIITSDDANTIHTQNAETLHKMTEEEILEEQNKLLSNLNPDVVAFLKSKRAKQLPLNKSETVVNTNILTTNVENDDSIHSNTLWDNDILSHPNVNKWLHFNSLEKDKLAWIQGIKDSNTNSEQPYEARFNFDGYLQPYTVEYTEETKTLFHHGEEPHRPGYSLTELFELTRATVTQQRVVALNTLAGILQYKMADMYKDIIDIPICKFFFVIRYAMDENKTIVLEPALKAMRNLFYNRIDEASLDALIGFEEGTRQPCLENDKSEIVELETKESELKDFHLAEIDLVAAALRTDIVQRIYYILHTVKPSFNSVQYCLQILIRLSRDSVETAQKIVEAEHLIKTIINDFVPITSINFSFDPQIVYKGKPIISALKLLRILSLQCKDIANILVTKYNIFKPLSEYLSSGVDGLYGLRIQIESFLILSNLLDYGAGVNNVKSIFPLVVTALHKHVNGTDLHIHTSIPTCTHAAVLLQLVHKILILSDPFLASLKFQLYPLIRDGVEKWLMQLGNSDAFTCAHTRLVSSIVDCSVTLLKYDSNVTSTLTRPLKAFSASKGYNLLVKNLIPSSNLLSGIDQKNTDINNLLTLCSSVIDSAQKVLPILNVTSSIPVLSSIMKLLEFINDSKISNQFLDKLMKYLHAIKVTTPSLCSNWFTRMEIDLVFRIIKLATLATDINEAQKDILYAVANKLCYVLRIDKRCELDFLFNNIIFNKDWFTAERLINLMSVSDSSLSMGDTSVEEIKKCYSKTINLSYKDVGPNVVLRKWQEPILPRDWIYLPILKMYSESQDLKDTPKVGREHAKNVEILAAKEKEIIVSCSLQWIIFNELCFPDLLTDIDITDRFCRIMCVFMCDTSLFLDKKIKMLLRECIGILFKKEKISGFDFDKQLTGLHNFQDFYTQFLEQFQSVSYGDHNFAACVLVPLAQNHNIKWRKLLWSEYAGCLRALDCPADLLCYDLSWYLTPIEKDESVLKSYARALSGNLLRPNTIAHGIASHHVLCRKNKA